MPNTRTDFGVQLRQFVPAVENAELIGDPIWTPLGITPNHPEYPAAHGCVTGTVSRLIKVNSRFAKSLGGVAPAGNHLIVAPSR